jgi:hypothetical protein
MILKERLFSNMFYRNMLTDLGFRSTYSARKNDPPFFQYKIGAYKPDYYLYFPKEPFAIRYTNEIFNKIWEYNGYEVSKYLDFHYYTCTQKNEFLRFLQYEIEGRIRLKLAKALRFKLNFVFQWIQDKQTELQAGQENHHSGHAIKYGNSSGEDSQNFDGRFDSLLNIFEEKMEQISKIYNTGNVQLVNSGHIPKLIQLFILLRDLKTPYKRGSGQEELFKSFSSTDLACLLQQHFAHFQHKKINTIQKDILAQNSELDINQENIKKLNKALVEYFFEK